jgi:hypothetical protein
MAVMDAFCEVWQKLVVPLFDLTTSQTMSFAWFRKMGFVLSSAKAVTEKT